MYPKGKCPNCYYFLYHRDDGGVICGKCRWTPDDIQVGKRPITITKAQKLGFKDAYYSDDMAEIEGFALYENYDGKQVKVTFLVEPGEDHGVTWDDIKYVGLVKNLVTPKRIDPIIIEPDNSADDAYDYDFGYTEWFPYPPKN